MRLNIFVLIFTIFFTTRMNCLAVDTLEQKSFLLPLTPEKMKKFIDKEELQKAHSESLLNDVASISKFLCSVSEEEFVSLFKEAIMHRPEDSYSHPYQQELDQHIDSIFNISGEDSLERIKASLKFIKEQKVDLTFQSISQFLKYKIYNEVVNFKKKKEQSDKWFSNKLRIYLRNIGFDSNYTLRGFIGAKPFSQALANKMQWKDSNLYPLHGEWTHMIQLIVVHYTASKGLIHLHNKLYEITKFMSNKVDSKYIFNHHHTGSNQRYVTQELRNLWSLTFDVAIEQIPIYLDDSTKLSADSFSSPFATHKFLKNPEHGLYALIRRDTKRIAQYRASLPPEVIYIYDQIKNQKSSIRHLINNIDHKCDLTKENTQEILEDYRKIEKLCDLSPSNISNIKINERKLAKMLVNIPDYTFTKLKHAKKYYISTIRGQNHPLYKDFFNPNKYSHLSKPLGELQEQEHALTYACDFNLFKEYNFKWNKEELTQQIQAYYFVKHFAKQDSSDLRTLFYVLKKLYKVKTRAEDLYETLASPFHIAKCKKPTQYLSEIKLLTHANPYFKFMKQQDLEPYLFLITANLDSLKNLNKLIYEKIFENIKLFYQSSYISPKNEQEILAKMSHYFDSDQSQRTKQKEQNPNLAYLDEVLRVCHPLRLSNTSQQDIPKEIFAISCWHLNPQTKEKIEYYFQQIINQFEKDIISAKQTGKNPYEILHNFFTALDFLHPLTDKTSRTRLAALLFVHEKYNKILPLMIWNNPIEKLTVEDFISSCQKAEQNCYEFKTKVRPYLENFGTFTELSTASLTEEVSAFLEANKQKDCLLSLEKFKNFIKPPAPLQYGFTKLEGFADPQPY
jgi:hypothetical protein